MTRFPKLKALIEIEGNLSDLAECIQNFSDFIALEVI